MTTILADSFTSALAKLSNQEQKQAKLTAFDFGGFSRQEARRITVKVINHFGDEVLKVFGV